MSNWRKQRGLEPKIGSIGWLEETMGFVADDTDPHSVVFRHPSGVCTSLDALLRVLQTNRTTDPTALGEFITAIKEQIQHAEAQA